MANVTRFLFSGWGRKAAWAVLLAFVALQALTPSLFERTRLTLFDLYQTTQPRLPQTSPVLIVAIDEASLKSVGQWPWPRHVLAQLVAKIVEGKPTAVGLDMILPEADRTSPEEWLKDAGNMPGVLKATIRALPKHDDALAVALRSGPVVIGVGGIRLTQPQADNGPWAPFLLRDPAGATASPPTLPSFNAALRSIAALDTAAPGHGLISVDAGVDGKFRRVPLVSVVANRLAPSMALELLRLRAKRATIALYSENDRVKGVEVEKAQRIPTQADGSVWVHFSPDEPRRVPAIDVLAGNFDSKAFENRIVLVGATAFGLADLRPTPVGIMPGIEITAQLLENVLDARLVHRPDWTRYAEPALTLLFGAFLIAVLRLVRVPWQILLTAGVIAALGAIGFGFWRALTLVDVATPALGSAFVFFTFFAANSAEGEKRKRQIKLQLAKAEGEMEAGRRIQMGMLPGVASVAGDERFDLGALMVPARQIGGDLYDFFKIDERRLFFAVGDVSGKGVPAALFMALGKSLCRSYALRGTNDVGTIIRLANGEIARDNPEMLFITMFAGILDLETGGVEFCNAGHDAPFVLRPGAVPQAVVAEGGPPLCVIEDFGYKTERLRLKPGDVLCVTTDGVAEAMDASGALLGSARTKDILAAIPRDANATEVVDELYKGVGRFVGKAEASDDLTVLAIRWNGA